MAKTIRRGEPRAPLKPPAPPAPPVPPAPRRSKVVEGFKGAEGYEDIIEEGVRSATAGVEERAALDPQFQPFQYEAGRESRRAMLGDIQEVIDHLQDMPVPFNSGITDDNGKRVGSMALGKREGARTEAPAGAAAILVIEFKPVEREVLEGFLREVYASVAQASWKGRSGEVVASRVFKHEGRNVGSFWYVER